jgi:predicted dehydrogenase
MRAGRASSVADFGWGLVGPGAIAHQWAGVVQALPGMHLRSVHARDAGRAAHFAQTWARPGRPVPQAVAELEAMLADPQVQAVYIATPHSHHAAFVRRCLQAGKPVLCEKPLVPTQALAVELVALSRQKGVFLMEALWTRFLPAYTQVRRWLQAGAIGAVQGIQSTFCFSVPFDAHSRLFDPALAGGTLLDIGLYNLAVTRWVLQSVHGDCPEPLSLQATGVLAPSGVDQRVAATLRFPGGVVSQFVCAFDTVADNSLRILGSQGCISVPAPFWGATEAQLQQPDADPVRVAAPHAINGFEGEVAEAVRCVRAGLFESPQMPHSETLALLGWTDELRRQLGVRYPFEAAG